MPVPEPVRPPEADPSPPPAGAGTVPRDGVRPWVAVVTITVGVLGWPFAAVGLVLRFASVAGWLAFAAFVLIAATGRGYVVASRRNPVSARGTIAAFSLVWGWTMLVAVLLGHLIRDASSQPIQ